MALSRRNFLNGFLGIFSLGGLAAVFGPVIQYLSPVKQNGDTVSSVVAAKVNELTPNSGKIFKFGSKPGILIMTPDGENRAFTAVCTHLGCTVQYSSEDQDIWCACHNGHYDLNGNVISGPPPRALEQYKCFVKGNEIIVQKENT
ncbi:MAG: Rieske (2Fe-2S) protein [Acidobacteria bacterium]|nr:Rieske (2Fe-2S) protein [Acidobacteriota bacterium]